MQCPSCRFENMPGQQRCVRCQSPMALGAVSVRPPRAADSTLRQRLRWQVRRRVPTAWLRRLADLRDAARRPWAGFPTRVLLLGVVPGLPQLLGGRQRLGIGLLAGWLCLLLGAALTAGTWLGIWLLTAGILVHSCSLQLALSPQLRRLSWIPRLAVGVGLFVALRVLVYEPPLWGISQLARPVSVANTGGSGLVPGGLGGGEVLLVTGPRLRPRSYVPGDVVLYRIGHVADSGFIVRGGHGLDRLLATAGQRMQLTRGTLTVDGEPPPTGRRPLGPLAELPELDVTIGPGEVGVIPSLLDLDEAALGSGRGQPLWERVCRVRQESLEGRAVWRLWPLSDFGPLR